MSGLELIHKCEEYSCCTECIYDSECHTFRSAYGVSPYNLFGIDDKEIARRVKIDEDR